MIERCIMIFPEFSNVSVIDEIRAKYDPLAHHVRPHITLVFPFQSDISTSELKAHLENVLSEIEPFVITLQGITAAQSFGSYLFLEITEGTEKLVEIHKRLYTGLLESIQPQWLKAGGYHPHMTVGKVADEKEYKAAIEDVRDIKNVFASLVKKISVEIIDENEDSIIEIEIPLN